MRDQRGSRQHLTLDLESHLAATFAIANVEMNEIAFTSGLDILSDRHTLQSIPLPSSAVVDQLLTRDSHTRAIAPFAIADGTATATAEREARTALGFTGDFGLAIQGGVFRLRHRRSKRQAERQ